MGSVSPLLVYSPRAKNDFNFMTSHTDWPSDMYLVGACECVSFMQNNPDVYVYWKILLSIADFVFMS